MSHSSLALAAAATLLAATPLAAAEPVRTARPAATTPAANDGYVARRAPNGQYCIKATRAAAAERLALRQYRPTCQAERHWNSQGVRFSKR